MRLLFLALLALLGASLAVAGPLGDWVDGTAVPFGGPTDGQDPHVASGGLKEGSCGYGELDASAWPHWQVLAVSPTLALAANATRRPQLGCGACLELRCDPRPGFEGRCPPNSEASNLVALVTDTCKDCGPDKVTLHYLAFQQKLANPEQGEVGIRYRLVECTPPGTVQIAIDTYRATEGGYLRLSLENVAGSGALAAVELRKSPLGGDRLSLAGTTWTRLTNSWGSKWELSGLPDAPLDLRLTSDSGQELVAREAITQAGVTGVVTTGVQFGTSDSAGVADAPTKAPIRPTVAATACNQSVMAFVRGHPELSVLAGHLEAAGVAPLLEDTSAALTLFAPADGAWAAVPASVDLRDRETLQAVLTFLIVQGQVAVPEPSQLLPEDLEAGGVALKLDTLNGASLVVQASPGGIALRDGSSLTPDAILASANNAVCASVVNILAAAVPMPFT